MNCWPFTKAYYSEPNRGFPEPQRSKGNPCCDPELISHTFLKQCWKEHWRLMLQATAPRWDAKTLISSDRTNWNTSNLHTEPQSFKALQSVPILWSYLMWCIDLVLSTKQQLYREKKVLQFASYLNALLLLRQHGHLWNCLTPPICDWFLQLSGYGNVKYANRRQL